MDPLLAALLIQFICFCVSEILPFLKNYPNGIVHTLVEYCRQNPTLIESTLNETEKQLRAAGQEIPADFVHIVEQSVDSLSKPPSSTPNPIA